MRKVPWLFLMATILLATIPRTTHAQQDSTMLVHYIDVGQGAAVLLEFPCGAVLIDAGAQNDDAHKTLVDYLTKFFNRRKDLDKTIALVLVTHPHIDHNEVLQDVGKTFHIKRYIDDGLREGSGKTNQKWMEDNCAALGGIYHSYSFEDITKNGNRKGKTDSIIDPINCINGDPKIYLYGGRLETKPDDWSEKDYGNPNNQSLVIKVTFGRSSFLFTGDLETRGIRNIVEEYANTMALKADILMVGHHGAANATTDDYLKAVAPAAAVISCGQWDFGKDSKSPYTTYAYGHPRVNILNMLQQYISGDRPHAIQVHAADGVRNFRLMNIQRLIYATAWDHNIIIRATTGRNYTVSTEN